MTTNISTVWNILDFDVVLIIFWVLFDDCIVYLDYCIRWINSFGMIVQKIIHSERKTAKKDSMYCCKYRSTIINSPSSKNISKRKRNQKLHNLIANLYHKCINKRLHSHTPSSSKLIAYCCHLEFNTSMHSLTISRMFVSIITIN